MVEQEDAEELAGVEVAEAPVAEARLAEDAERAQLARVRRQPEAPEEDVPVRQRRPSRRRWLAVP